MTSFCDVDVRSDLSADAFLRDYLSIQKPVLIKNALHGDLIEDIEFIVIYFYDLRQQMA